MIFKEITIREAKELIKEIKENKEYNSLVKELEYFISLKDNQISNEVLNELQELMGRIKKLIELDEKIKEKEDMIKLFEEISADFKEQNIRKEDLSKISNGELFKIVEEIDSINGKEEKNLDLIFITRSEADKYKKNHKKEYRGNLKIKIIDNKDKILEKILRYIEKNY